MPISVKEALTRNGELIVDERASTARYHAREISFYIFRRSVEVNGSLGYRDTVDVIECYAHHYNANRTASHDAPRRLFSSLVDSFANSMKTGDGKLAAVSNFYSTRYGPSRMSIVRVGRNADEIYIASATRTRKA